MQSKCDLLHGSSGCPSDTVDLVIFGASCGTIVTATAMDDLLDYNVYFLNSTDEWSSSSYSPDTQGQWLWLSHNGCIGDVSCYNERPFTLQRDYLFAASGTAHSWKFCVGLVTAECESPDLSATYYQDNHSDHRTSWINGYGRWTTRNQEARKACMKAPKYARHSVLLSSVAE